MSGTTSQDSAVVWDATPVHETRRLVGHQALVVQATVTADASRIYSADTEGGLRTWELESGKQLAAKELADEIFSLHLADDDQRLFVQTKTERLIFDVQTWKRLAPEEWEPSKARVVSADWQWMVAPAGVDVLLVDLLYKDAPHEDAYRHARASGK